MMNNIKLMVEMLIMKKYRIYSKNSDSDYLKDALRQTILEKNNDFFYYFKKGLQGASIAIIVTLIHKGATIQTISPLIRNRMAIANTPTNLGFKFADYRTRHFYLYGFLGGIGYDIIVNQETFFQNTPMGLGLNHFLFGGLFAGLFNLKYAYKGAMISSFVGSILVAYKFKSFKRRYPPGFKIQYKDIPEELKEEISEREKLEFLSFNAMNELQPIIDINGFRTFGYI